MWIRDSTTSEQCPAQVRADGAAAANGSFTEGLAWRRQSVITGVWQSTGSTVTYPVVEQLGHWRAPILNRSSTDGQPTPQAKPAYRVGLACSDVIKRAQARLSVPGDVFSRYASQSIAEYLNDPAVADVDRSGRQRQFAAKFTETLALARPVVGVDEMLSLIHI